MAGTGGRECWREESITLREFRQAVGRWPPIDVTQKGAGRRSNVKQSLSEKAASHLPTGPHQHRRRRTDLILGNAFLLAPWAETQEKKFTEGYLFAKEQVVCVSYTLLGQS